MTNAIIAETATAQGPTSANPDSRISVLFLINHSIEDASCRYRIYQFLPYLERSGFDCSVRPFTTAELFRLLKRPGAYAAKLAWTMRSSARRLGDIVGSRGYSLLFVHREAFPFGTPLAERLCRHYNSRMIFSFDDAIYAGHPDGEVQSHKLLYRLKYGPQVDWVLKNSAHVIAGNRILAAYARRFSENVSIVPTVVDTQKLRPANRREGGKVRIGWIGSPSTSSYLRPLIPVFQELLKRFPGRVEFLIVGDPAFPRFASEAEIRPFRMESEVEDIQSFDIGLMPLPRNAWSEGKCAFKAIQYMAAGVPAIASPVGMVEDLIENGKTGLLAESSNEWLSQLSILVDTAAYRSDLSLQGRLRVEQDFSLQVWGPRFATLLRSIYDRCND